jgi:uncharacterized zinc-type alcohol dehydrogenase-like protein
MTRARGYAVYSSSTPFEAFSFERRDLRPNDVRLDILYCGVCHSDIHTARGHWDGLVYPNGTSYPCVPGHEIVGRIDAAGKDVTGLKVGDLVGIGCMVDSCMRCNACNSGLEQYCEQGTTWTYNSPDRVDGEITLGGYSDSIVVRSDFLLKLAHDEKDLGAAAPLLCAGITMWSPLKHWHAGPGKKIGIVGIGGLGHMGIKLAHALDTHVVAFTTSDSKRDAALKLGADETVVSRNADEMATQAHSFDLIVNTVAASHDLDAYLSLLKLDGTMILVGIPEERHPSPSIANLVGLRRSLSGSLIGGIRETQEMLDFCAARNVTADVEIIPIQQLDNAYERMLKNDVKYRFVIDMTSLK